MTSAPELALMDTPSHREVGMSQYVFDQTWERERDRLRSLESIYDQATVRFLADLG